MNGAAAPSAEAALRKSRRLIWLVVFMVRLDAVCFITGFVSDYGLTERRTILNPNLEALQADRPEVFDTDGLAA
jgi:hypothetical protein